MTGPVLVFGGCYGNIEATESLLGLATAFGIPPTRAICTGDVVAYCADARETVRLIRDSGVHVVMGNCEESLGMAADDCGCGFPEDSACDRMSAAWYAYAGAQLDENDRAWMRSLPRRIDIALGERRLAVVHGGVDAINQFIFGSADHDLLKRQIDLSGCDGVVGGHCGIPFSRVIGGRLWHNPGAIGLPANDGTVRTWCSLLVPSEHGITIEHRALDYDHRTAAAKIRAAGLPEGYAAALETGLWPSCDVLTPEELAHRGQPIEPGTITWERASTSEVVWPARWATHQFPKSAIPK